MYVAHHPTAYTGRGLPPRLDNNQSTNPGMSWQGKESSPRPPRPPNPPVGFKGKQYTNPKVSRTRKKPSAPCPSAAPKGRSDHHYQNSRVYAQSDTNVDVGNGGSYRATGQPHRHSMPTVSNSSVKVRALPSDHDSNHEHRVTLGLDHVESTTGYSNTSPFDTECPYPSSQQRPQGYGSSTLNQPQVTTWNDSGCRGSLADSQYCFPESGQHADDLASPRMSRHGSVISQTDQEAYEATRANNIAASNQQRPALDRTLSYLRRKRNNRQDDRHSMGTYIMASPENQQDLDLQNGMNTLRIYEDDGAAGKNQTRNERFSVGSSTTTHFGSSNSEGSMYSSPASDDDEPFELAVAPSTQQCSERLCSLD